MHRRLTCCLSKANGFSCCETLTASSCGLSTSQSSSILLAADFFENRRSIFGLCWICIMRVVAAVIAGGVVMCLMVAGTWSRLSEARQGEKMGNVTMATGYLCIEGGRWISKERVCDGVRDCGRLGDDEAFCLDAPQPSLCRDLLNNSPVYNCINTTDICLPHSYFCDDYIDCGMQEDELYCDQQYIPGCSFGILQVTCTNVTLNASLDRSVPNNIRFISLNGVTSAAGTGQAVSALVSLERYAYLVKLYLVNNNFTQLHLGEPNSLKYLRSLHVSKNNIRTVESSSFVAAPNLVHLELPNNEIVHIEPRAFEGLTSLTELNIVGNKIQTVSAACFQTLYSLEIINMSHNDIMDLAPGTFQSIANVSFMSLSYNSMKFLRKGTFLGLAGVSSLDIDNVPIRYIEHGALEGLTALRSFELSFNALEFMYPDTFQDLASLQHLSIRGNPLSTLQKGNFRGLHDVSNLILVSNNISLVEPGAFEGLDNLIYLDLGNNTFTDLEADTFAGVPNLQVLWMSHVPLRHIEPGAFNGLSRVVSLNILHADLQAPSMGILDGLDSLTSLSTRDYRLCCLLDPARNVSCIGPTESFWTCQRMMPNTILRVAIWLLGISAILGNLYVIGQRAVKKGWRELTVQSILITHLAISDALMGAYMIAIGAADLHFGAGYFLSAEAWREGALCKAIGFLSMLSSEASVFLVMLISLDRFISIAFPFSRFRLEARFVRFTIAAFWLIAFALSLTGTIMADKMPSFYGLSDVCVGLPLITTPVNQTTTWTYIRDTGTYAYNASATGTQPAWAFSVFLYLGLNFVCFIVVLVCYVLIFIIVRRSSRNVARRGKMAGKPSNGAYRGAASHHSVTFSREVKLASRMALVVGTDFFCWMPIIIVGILTQSGAISVPEELYAWIVVFILPINSSLNPYLYTIAEMCSKQRKKSKKSAQCIRMTCTMNRLSDNDKTVNATADSDTVGGYISRGS